MRWEITDLATGGEQDEPFPIRTAKIAGPRGRPRHRRLGVRRWDSVNRSECAAPSAAAPTAAAAIGRRPVARRRHPGADRRRPRPQRRQGRPLVHRHRLRWQARADRGRAEVRRDFNDAQKDIYLSAEIYDNSVAANQLQLEIAAGNPPDIIGPVGVEGLNIFRDNLLDLAPLIASQKFDMTKYDPALVDFFNMGKNGATIGLPFATYPSFIYYNKKLFDEAKLPYPPTKVGEHVQRQAVGHGSRPRARHEAHRRQERQRRHERELRSQEHRPVGLRHAVGRRPLRHRSHHLRRQLRRRRRRQDRPDHAPVHARA